MNSKRNNVRLECLANDLREQMSILTKEPVRIHQILKTKGILAWFRKLDPEFSGMAIRTQSDIASPSKRFMLINSAQSYGKQRFTACHELYHLLYQEEFTVSQNNAGKFDVKEPEEYNADVFASFLLLPENGLKELVPVDEQEKDKIQLATILKVEQNYRCSRITLLRRLKDLKWITAIVYDKYARNVKSSATEYGYSPDLYNPTNDTELVGDYNIKARELYDKGLISQAKYFSLLEDIGVKFSSFIDDEE